MTGTSALEGGVSFISKTSVAVTGSMVPELWLPLDACSVFGKAFGLTLNVSTDFYFVNQTIYDQLTQINPCVPRSLVLSNNSADCRDHAVRLPVWRFRPRSIISLVLKPRVETVLSIRRANDSFDHVLGRVFFQEAYVIADFERSTFLVHKALYQNFVPAQDWSAYCL